MKSIVFIPTLILLALLNSCQIIDKPEEVPSFIYVESFDRHRQIALRDCLQGPS
mgnify:CR=1 FL=1